MLSGIVGCDNLLDFGNETHLESSKWLHSTIFQVPFVTYEGCMRLAFTENDERNGLKKSKACSFFGYECLHNFLSNIAITYNFFCGDDQIYRTCF